MLQSMGLQRVRRDLVMEQQQQLGSGTGGREVMGGSPMEPNLCGQLILMVFAAMWPLGPGS